MASHLNAIGFATDNGKINLMKTIILKNYLVTPFEAASAAVTSGCNGIVVSANSPSLPGSVSVWTAWPSYIGSDCRCSSARPGSNLGYGHMEQSAKARFQLFIVVELKLSKFRMCLNNVDAERYDRVLSFLQIFFFRACD